VKPDDELMIKAWRLAERAVLRDRPNATAELTVSIRDVSLGGIGITVEGKDGESPKLLTGERVRIVLTHRQQELLLEGRVITIRPVQARKDVVNAGLKFTNTESGLQGRQVLNDLTKIVGHLQREEARRSRLGMTG
jgi:Tfp pilus assembly protein PilZ